MVLIKDRHTTFANVIWSHFAGKYDTYKGSTLSTSFDGFLHAMKGTMVLIKNRHLLYSTLTVQSSVVEI